jgi:hypothetical protein
MQIAALKTILLSFIINGQGPKRVVNAIMEI